MHACYYQQQTSTFWKTHKQVTGTKASFNWNKLADFWKLDFAFIYFVHFSSKWLFFVEYNTILFVSSFLVHTFASFNILKISNHFLNIWIRKIILDNAVNCKGCEIRTKFQGSRSKKSLGMYGRASTNRLHLSLSLNAAFHPVTKRTMRPFRTQTSPFISESALTLIWQHLICDAVFFLARRLCSLSIAVEVCCLICDNKDCADYLPLRLQLL